MMRQTPISHEVMAELRMMIETIVAEAVERALSQAGEISFARIGNAQGTTEVADDKRDAWAHTSDVLTEHPRMPRLYSPAGILFNQPAKDETVHILRAKDCGGPGAELAIPDGGDGSQDHLPEWYADKAGISVDDKVAVLESRTDDVEVTSGDGKVVKVNGDDYSLLKTETFLADLNDLLSTMISIISSGTAMGPLLGLALPATLVRVPPLGTGAQALATLAATLAVTSSYKSTKAKNG